MARHTGGCNMREDRALSRGSQMSDIGTGDGSRKRQQRRGIRGITILFSKFYVPTPTRVSQLPPNTLPYPWGNARMGAMRDALIQGHMWGAVSCFICHARLHQHILILFVVESSNARQDLALEELQGSASPC